MPGRRFASRAPAQRKTVFTILNETRKRVERRERERNEEGEGRGRAAGANVLARAGAQEHADPDGDRKAHETEEPAAFASHE